MLKGDLQGIVRARLLKPCNDQEHQGEPFLGFHLQRSRCAGRRWNLVSIFWFATQPYDLSCCSEFQVGFIGRQCPEAKIRALMTILLRQDSE